jgi:DNA-binding NarL/FixJ family response regulator
LRARRPDHLRLFTRERYAESVPAGTHDYNPQSPAESRRTAIRVLVVARRAIVRACYRTLLESHDRIEIVVEASDRDRALRLARAIEPHVALLDLAGADLDVPEAIAAMVSQAEPASLAVMLIAPPDSDERVLPALRAGANGVLPTDAEPAELIAAVHLLADGKALLPAGAMRRVLNERIAPPKLGRSVAERLNKLTEREREIAALAATGLTNAEIAERLVISPATAKTHVSRAMIKLHARHRAELVAMAYEAGLVGASVFDGERVPN